MAHGDGRRGRVVVEAGFTPCWIDEEGRPVAHGDDEQGRATADYVAEISEEAGLDTPLRWRDGQVVFYERATS